MPCGLPFGILPDMEAQHCIVLCTCPDQASADHIAQTLVTEQLAACVNIIDGVKSVYLWQGEMESSHELQLIIKTHSRCYGALEQRLRALHPYELPEIIAVPIEAGLPEYLAWLDETTRATTD